MPKEGEKVVSKIQVWKVLAIMINIYTSEGGVPGF